MLVVNPSEIQLKRDGFYVPIGSEFADENKVRYRVDKAKKPCSCAGCAFENHRTRYGKELCNSVVCGWDSRMDGIDAIVSVVYAPADMREVLALCKK